MYKSTYSITIPHLRQNHLHRSPLHSIIIIVILLGILAVFNLPVMGQGYNSGSFVGEITDSRSGSGIQGAIITFKSRDTGIVLVTKTDQNGKFTRASVPPGTYDIEASADSYESKSTTLPLFATRSNQVVPVPFRLDKKSVAAADAKVPAIADNTPPAPSTSPMPPSDPDVKTGGTITPESPEGIVDLNTQREGRFDENQVRNLPLGGSTLTRTFDELALLIPGVAPAPQAIGNTVGPGVGGGVGTSGQFAVNGLRSRANNFTVDGSDNNDEDIGVRRQGFFSLVPQPIESIQEFSIITLLAPAEFGRNLGAQVNAVSKSGSNQLNGTLFGLFNSNKLNARNFFDNASGNSTTPLQGRRFADGQLIPVFVNNNPVQVTNNSGEEDSSTLVQGGFAVGGRILRDKLFYFASGEGQLLNAVQEKHFTVPTVEQRGLFGTGAQGLFLPFGEAGALPIFSSAIQSAAVSSLLPFPNDPAGIFGRNTYTQTLSSDARGRILAGKITYILFQGTARPQFLNARYNYTDDKRDLTDVGGAIFSTTRPLVRNDNFTTYLEGGLSNAISNEFRFSLGRTRLRFEELRDETGFLQPVNSNSFGNPQDAQFLLNSQVLLNTTRATCRNGAATCFADNVIFAPRVDYVSARDSQGNLLTSATSGLGLIGQLRIAGFSPVGVDVFNFPQERVNNTFQLADTIRWQIGGGHNLSFGTDIRHVLLDSNLPRNSRPLITFNTGVDETGFSDNGFLQGTDLVAAGAVTGFFQSLIANGENAKIKLSYDQLNFFAQDEWQVKRNLKLNFGLRYEYNTVPEEADKKIEKTFATNFTFPLSGLNDFIEGRTKIYESDSNNFAPRFGFAYGPASGTVIRGGFGMYYDQIIGAVVGQSRNVFPTFTTINFGGGLLAANDGQFTLFNPRNAIFDMVSGAVCNSRDNDAACVPARSIPFIQPGTLNTINAGISPVQLQRALEDIFREFPQANGNLFGATFPKRNLDTPFSYQYSIGFEQKLFKNTFVSVAYVGTTGRNLLRFTTPNLGSNYIGRIDEFRGGRTCSTRDALACAVIALGTTFDPFDTSGSGLERPNPNIGPINRFETSGRSRYDSLQIELRGRLTSDIQYRTSYVFGKVKDDVSDVFDLAGAFALPQNSLTFEGEYAPANFDVRHRFTYNFVYDLPKLNDANIFVKNLLGGWQIAGTGKVSSGQPFTVNTIFDVNLDGNLTDRLNDAQSVSESNDRRRRLIINNTTNALAELRDDGAVPRNSFRAAGIIDVDLSFAKRFFINERQNLQFRIDIFNFINRANFGIPVRFLEAPSFGEAVDTVTPGRRIQIGLKYFF
jgi:hypothetical protein